MKFFSFILAAIASVSYAHGVPESIRNETVEFHPAPGAVCDPTRRYAYDRETNERFWEYFGRALMH
jgi:hypothetical protein